MGNGNRGERAGFVSLRLRSGHARCPLRGTAPTLASCTKGAAGMTPWPRLPFSEGALKNDLADQDAGKTAPSEHFLGFVSLRGARGDGRV